MMEFRVLHPFLIAVFALQPLVHFTFSRMAVKRVVLGVLALVVSEMGTTPFRV